MVAELNMLEGMVIMATCDKVVPGMLMGAFRVNIPTTMLTGGYMAAGCYEDRMLTLTHTKQAYAAYVEGDMSREEYKLLFAMHVQLREHVLLWELPILCVPWQRSWDFPHMEMRL